MKSQYTNTGAKRIN